MLDEYPERSAELAKLLAEQEQDGDRITHALILRLSELDPERAPFPIGDGYRLASTIDDIVDHAEQTAAQLTMYGVEATIEQAVSLADVLARTGASTAAALEALADGETLTEHLTEIHTLENEGDRLLRAGVADLFAGGIDPMVVIRWKDIYESLESAIDACEHVAIAIEGLLLTRG